MKTFFITGAAGFVGSNILRRLVAEHHTIHILLKKNTSVWRISDLIENPCVIVHEGDLLDRDFLTALLKKIQPDVIYHLAARGAYSTQNDATEILSTNILGTANLLQATAEVPYQLFVNTGSSSEYGLKNAPMSEGNILEPASYYAVAKSAATLLAQFEANSKSKPIVTLRLFSVYGPYEEPTRLFPTLFQNIFLHQPVQLVSPTIARDFIYIDDVVDLYLEIEKLQVHAGGCFNVGTGVQSTLQDVVTTAEKVTGKKLQYTWGGMKPRVWDSTCWVADMTHTQEVLGWQAETSLATGMEKMWNWFLAHETGLK